jgi:hypothetical protein
MSADEGRPPAKYPKEAGSEAASGGVTRRGLVGVAGGAAASGLALGAAPAIAAPHAKSLGARLTDRRSIGFVARIDQNGPQLTGYGYLTRIEGLRQSLIFTEPRGTSSFDPSTADPSTARFTHFCQARVKSVSALDDVITVLATGVITFFFQPNGGASFDDPRSFGLGRRIASFQTEFQDDLALDAPERANVQLTANLDQRGAAPFRIGETSRRLGAKGLHWTLEANGRGELLDPGPPQSTLMLSGTLGVGDANRP